MWNLVFAFLEPIDKVQLGLCSKHAKSSCSKLWYTGAIFQKSNPGNRIIRKLSITLRQLHAYSKGIFLNGLSHLHVSNDNNALVHTIRLPRNLTYCFLERSPCLRKCLLPDSLRFFETDESGVYFCNLDNHPNLTVLRVRDWCRRPPNLIELEMDKSAELNSIAGILPQSLVRCSFSDSDISHIPILPNVTDLDVGCMSNCQEIVSRIFPNVNHLSFAQHLTQNKIDLLPRFFPQATHLTIDCWKLDQDLPVFPLVRKMHVYIASLPRALCSVNFANWTCLQDLTLSISCATRIIPLYLPDNLKRLKLKIHCNKRVCVVLPASVEYLFLESENTLVDVTISNNSQLRTLRTIRNVFATELQLPESLRSFHVRLSLDESLDCKWDPLLANVDFQVIRE